MRRVEAGVRLVANLGPPFTYERKRCDCEGTRSGPRPILDLAAVREIPGADAFEMWPQLAQLACDVCDTPWSFEVEPTGEVKPT